MTDEITYLTHEDCVQIRLKIEETTKECLDKIHDATSTKELREIWNEYMSKKGKFTQFNQYLNPKKYKYPGEY